MICPLCRRPLGVATEQHHLVPKTFKGAETVELHRICHRKIHATFSERELKNRYHTIERLLEHDDIRAFVDWVRNKDRDFYDSNKFTRELRKRKRR
jgi:hypothetical protein